jgi:hypothetical protein
MPEAAAAAAAYISEGLYKSLRRYNTMPFFFILIFLRIDYLTTYD